MFRVTIANNNGCSTFYPTDEDIARRSFEDACNKPDTIFACYGEFGKGAGDQANIYVAPETGFQTC